MGARPAHGRGALCGGTSSVAVLNTTSTSPKELAYVEFFLRHSHPGRFYCQAVRLFQQCITARAARVRIAGRSRARTHRITRSGRDSTHSLRTSRSIERSRTGRRIAKRSRALGTRMTWGCEARLITGSARRCAVHCCRRLFASLSFYSATTTGIGKRDGLFSTQDIRWRLKNRRARASGTRRSARRSASFNRRASLLQS